MRDNGVGWRKRRGKDRRGKAGGEEEGGGMAEGEREGRKL